MLTRVFVYVTLVYFNSVQIVVKSINNSVGNMQQYTDSQLALYSRFIYGIPSYEIDVTNLMCLKSSF